MSYLESLSKHEYILQPQGLIRVVPTRPVTGLIQFAFFPFCTRSTKSGMPVALFRGCTSTSEAGLCTWALNDNTNPLHSCYHHGILDDFDTFTCQIIGFQNDLDLFGEGIRSYYDFAGECPGIRFGTLKSWLHFID